MVFFIPNPLSLYRIKTFSTKEPDTLDWIDSFNEDSVMWSGHGDIKCYDKQYISEQRKYEDSSDNTC